LPWAKQGGFAIAASLAGMVLPGGSAMKNVPGQIEAAAAGLAAGVPTVGLCLGMQTMATAIAWRRFGRGTANLAEADPGGADQDLRADGRREGHGWAFIAGAQDRYAAERCEGANPSC
jgi:CTP synthase (UTP-ammonia lyase)